MACHAVRAESEDVVLRESEVHIKVAICAGILVERRSIAGNMAIAAGKGLSIGTSCVRGKYKACAVMVEERGTPPIG